MTMEIKYGESLTRDFDALPEASRKAIATKGLAHYLGNEVSSRVTAWIKSQDSTPSEEQIAAAKGQFRVQFVTAMDEGKIGVREGGPRLDPVDREFRDLVLARAKSICETIGVALPGVARNGEAPPTILFPGDQVNLTREQLLDRIAHSTKPGNGSDLRKQAKTNVDARKRLAERGLQEVQNASTEALF